MSSPSAFREMPQWLFDLDDARPVAMPARPPSVIRHHEESLRARFASGGSSALTDRDLLELVLLRALPRGDVALLSERLIAAFGDYNRVLSAPVARLLKIEGMDSRLAQDLKIIEASAHRLARTRIMKRPVISSWNAVLDYCHTTMANGETEQFRILYLDRKNILIADEEQARGTVDHVPVYPREVVKRALELNASALILVHNHPSGDPTPSEADVTMTNQIRDAAEVLGIQLFDHLIIGKSRETSFRAEGYL
ncbi:RadC family protein [Celeribacter sp.]|uniref:RadC family protein n=1 Tax=Celeribacter sp. TaxID=1890673 RepID=UPI003A9013B3